MARIAPFRGILYNAEKIKDLSAVATPPFDVISDEERDAFHERHPRNMIRLILGKPTAQDTAADNPHTRAACYFKEWLAEGTLVRDEVPAYYFTETGFNCEGMASRLYRYGLISAVALVPFERGVVLPHEKTFSGVKTERLGLMKACHANFSPVFSLFSDKRGLIQRLREQVSGVRPGLDFVDSAGLSHKLWRITAAAMLGEITQGVADECLYIADGHHRYETALNYQRWVAEQEPAVAADHPANYVMMYLAAMEDPGLVILPAHRLLSGLTDSDLDGLLRRLSEYFELETVRVITNGELSLPAGFRLPESAGQAVIGLFVRTRPDLYLLRLKPGVMRRLFGEELAPSVADLDVTALTRLILMEMLGFDQARLDNHTLISYATGLATAIRRVRSGQCDAALLLNPTRIEQVRNIADEGQIMPRKSTYFYPKVITGQVINYLGRD